MKQTIKTTYINVKKKNPELFLWWIDLVAPSDSREVGNYEKNILLIISPINHLIEMKLKDNYWKLAKKEEEVEEVVVWYYQ